MKKIRNLLLVVLCLVGMFTLASCKKDVGPKVTIIQFTTAEPLDQAREGIIKALKDAGFEDGVNITIETMNPQRDLTTLDQMVETAVRQSDMIFAIATPVAQALKKETEKQGSNVPVLFTAVTDPVGDGIVDNAIRPGKNISGTTDMNPVAEQVAFLTEIKPGATKLGVLYSATEPNSIAQLNLVKAKAAELNITVEAKPIASVADLSASVDFLVSSGVDAIYLPTDNTVAENIQVILQRTNLNHIPTICGESTFVAAGGTITLGVNYTTLGLLTGEMGAKVLKNETVVGELPVGHDTNIKLVINKTAADANGITIPQTLIDRADNIL